MAEPGARFRGHNRTGWMRWSRVCEIVAVDAPHEIVWRTVATAVFPDSTDWRITLEPIGGDRTRIVQSFRVTKMPDWFNWLLVRLNPMHIDRGDALSGDLHRIAEIAAGEQARSRAS